MRGYDEAKGKYVRQPDLHNGQPYYKRSKPSVMYVYKAPWSPNWFFNPTLGEQGKKYSFC